MRAVSRFNQDSGGRPAPEVKAELLTLMNQLSGPPDFWDRPDGDFGPPDPSVRAGHGRAGAGELALPARIEGTTPR